MQATSTPHPPIKKPPGQSQSPPVKLTANLSLLLSAGRVLEKKYPAQHLNDQTVPRSSSLPVSALLSDSVPLPSSKRRAELALVPVL